MQNTRFIFILILSLIISGNFCITAQDTFSIVAIDPLTGEIGSAGASCLDDTDILGGVTIISDIIPGVGAIHTQSFWNIANQVNAHDRMISGDSPQEIIDWLIQNDVQNNPQIRQYGIVDLFEGQVRSAAFTGSDCFDVKEHITGATYAIQGNILLNDQIIDGMETAFNSTVGSLAEKLMAALQAANIPGADSRCLEEGVSSQSAFIRVALPDDDYSDLNMDLAVTLTPYGVEPIDSLQVLFDEWQSNNISIPEKSKIRVFPNPTNNEVSVTGLPDIMVHFELHDLQGRKLKSGILPSSGKIPLSDMNAQFLILRLQNSLGVPLYTEKLILQ